MTLEHHKNKKISILLPDLVIGGAEKLNVNLANHWVKQGISVEFVLMRGDGDLLDVVDKSVSIHVLGVSNIRGSIIPLVKYLLNVRPDSILAGLWPLTSAVLISWLISGKIGRLYLVEHNHLSISTYKESGVSYYVLSTVLRLTHRFASGVIAVSQGVKKDLCRSALLSDKQVEVIYNPAAKGISNASVLDRSNEIWRDESRVRILAAGTLTSQKDFKTLIYAFSRIYASLNAQLIILGDGPLRQKLSSLVDKLGMNHCVDLPGFVVDPDPWFYSADLFVLSSRWEGFGNVIVEALEFGLSVVSTDCPSGPAEILDDGKYGKLVPVGDSDKLAKAIVEVVNTPFNSSDLKKRACDFSIDKISTKYLEYIRIYESR